MLPPAGFGLYGLEVALDALLDLLDASVDLARRELVESADAKDCLRSHIRLVHFLSKSFAANSSTMKLMNERTLADKCFRLG